MRLSVIVPAHRCAQTLRRCLEALRRSELEGPWELIVVDDASGEEETPRVAAEFADRVLTLGPRPRGPAHARNVGAASSSAEFLAFVDADVCVHPNTLAGFVEVLDGDAEIGAVFGAYDTAPPARGVVSRFRNLQHHWVHARSPGPAETFWAGCGAVRRRAFESVGGFDAERYPRPQIEDIELGHRLRDAGWEILLAPRFQATHLKRWSLWGGLVTDVRDRGIPWVELLHRDRARGRRARALNLGLRERLATAAVGVAWLFLGVAAIMGDARWIAVAAVGAASALVVDAPLIAWLAREKGVGMALAAIPLRALYYTASIVSVIVGTARWLAAGRPGGGVTAEVVGR